jgi:protein ImuA
MQDDTLARLRRSLARIERVDWQEDATLFALGLSDIDDAIGGGLPRGALHEVFPESVADCGAGIGFALALALRANGNAGRPVLWVRQDMVAQEQGELHAAGLAEFGADPSAFLLVRARDAVQALRAADETLRCNALGVIVLEGWGEARALGLTASRRLARGAARAGCCVVLVRSGVAPAPSAAMSRWRVRASPSRLLAAEVPGRPAFDIGLLRHRAGYPPRRWRVEWDRDELVFRPPALSCAVAAFPADRPAAPAAAEGYRRAG